MPSGDQNRSVVVNGKHYVLGRERNLASLIEKLGAQAARIAVMVNDAVIPRDKWSSWPIKEGDRIEVLTFMGGG